MAIAHLLLGTLQCRVRRFPVGSIQEGGCFDHARYLFYCASDCVFRRLST